MPYHSTISRVVNASEPVGLNEAMRLPGNTLVFVDDTDFHGSDVANLVPDLRVLAAIRIESGSYRAIEVAIRNRLDQLCQTEFHASEILNPKAGERWREVSIADRIAIFDLVAGLIEQSQACMRYIYIGSDQFRRMRQSSEPNAKKAPGLGRNSALKRVFLGKLQEELISEGRPALIMVDQDRPRGGIEIDRSEQASWLIGGGVLTAPSRDVIGLQVADALAFGIGRRFRIARQFEAGTATALDYAAIRPLAAINGRSQVVLGRRS